MKPAIGWMLSAITWATLAACGDDDGQPAGADAGSGADAQGDSDGGPPPPACGAIATFADGLAPTRELHVDPAGSAAGDGSAGAPYGTIEQAAAQATPGTAITLHAGVHATDQYLADLHGSAQAPIWIRGAAGEARPIIMGGGEGLHFTRPRYLVIEGLELTGQTQNGMNLDDGADYDDPDAARFVVLRDLDVHDVGDAGNEDCLKLSGLNDFFVLDSHFARCGGGGAGSGIDHVGCHDGVIAHNRFAELSGNAVQAKGGSTDLLVLANRMDDAGERAVNLGGSTGLEFFRPSLSTAAPNAEARRIHVIANEIVGSEAAVAFVGCVDCLVANNTIVDPGHNIARILQETSTGGGYTFEPASDGRFINNLVYYDASVIVEHVNVGGGTAAATFVFSHNLWYAHDQPAASAPTLPVAEDGAVIGMNPGLSGPPTTLEICLASPPWRAGVVVPEVVATGCTDDMPSIGAHQGHSCTD